VCQFVVDGDGAEGIGNNTAGQERGEERHSLYVSILKEKRFTSV
jgi:hypothetical protein